jgi:hypothetical protein
MIYHIKSFPYYENNNENTDILYTKVPIDEIEHNIIKILDKHSELCKYYININDASFTISFNVDQSQLNAMIQTSFQINIYKYNNKPIVILSKEIQEHQQWTDLLVDLLKRFK